MLISGVLLPSSGFNFSFAIKMACMGEVLIVLHRVHHREVYCTAALGSDRGKGKMGTKRTGLHKGGQLCEAQIREQVSR